MGLAVTALSFAGLVSVGADAASAAKPVVTASYSGPVNCTAAGKTKYKPGLTNTVAARAVSIKAKLTCSTGPTGTAGVTVTGGKLTVTGTHTGSCANSTGPLSGSIKWNAAGGKVNPTQIQWPGLTRTFGPPIVDRIDSPPVTMSLDSSITSGSFHMTSGWFNGVEARFVDTGATQATCSARNGIKKLAFTGSVSVKGRLSTTLCSDAQDGCIADLQLTAGRGWFGAVNLAASVVPTGTIAYTSPDCPALFPATVPLTPHSSPFFLGGHPFGVYDDGPLTDWDPVRASCDMRFSFGGDAQTLRASYSY